MFFLLKKVKPATVTAYKNVVKEFTAFCKSKCPIAEILQSDITRYREYLAGKNGLQTIDNKIKVLRSLLNFAVDQGYLQGKNPVKVKNLQSKKEKLTGGYAIFEPDEVKAYFQSERFKAEKVTDPDYYWCLLLEIFTGCRVGELTSLQVGHLNTEPGSLVVVRDPRLAKPWKLSDKGMVFMAVWESGVLNGKFKGFPVRDGFILRVYDDHPENPRINKLTVGLGHVVQPEDNLKKGDEISLERAKEFFQKNIKEVETQVNRKIRVPLFQHEFDAIVSIAFNAGAYSGLVELADFVNSGNYERVPDLIKTYHAVSPGKLKRRASESNLFASGVYDATH